MNAVVGAEDFVPLAERLVLLQAFRLFLAVAVMAVPWISGDAHPSVFALTGAYLVVVAAGELFRRGAWSRRTWLCSGAVLLDGAYLTLCAWLTGGYESTLLALVVLDVMVVTLLLSYRTGLKVAIWCALLLGLLSAGAGFDGLQSSSATGTSQAVLTTLGLLLFALVAAAFSSVNERALRTSRSLLEAQVKLDTELEESSTSMDVLLRVANHLHDRLGFTRAAALTRRDSTWSGLCVDGASMTPIEEAAPAGTVAEAAWMTGTPRLLSTLDAEPFLATVLPNAVNVAVVPLVVRSDETALLVVEWGQGRSNKIPSALVRSISQSASHVAAVLRNARLLEELESLAQRDPLTGLANRRVFEDALRREAARAQRTIAPLSLILLDIDSFKEVNDTHGHQAGDAVLCDLGACLVANTKGFDLTARYGGDEFIVLLPGCSSSSAIGVYERLQAAMEQRPEAVRTTVSAGIATIPDDAHDATSLIGAADRALYAAKRRNRHRSVR